MLVRISVPGEMLSMLKSPDMTANAVLSPDFSFRFRKTLNSAWGQFHQHFMSSFCTEIILPKKLQSQTVTREKLRKTLPYKKGSIQMLMKLTPELRSWLGLRDSPCPDRPSCEDWLQTRLSDCHSVIDKKAQM